MEPDDPGVSIVVPTYSRPENWLRPSRAFLTNLSQQGDFLCTMQVTYARYRTYARGKSHIETQELNQRIFDRENSPNRRAFRFKIPP
jgi:hypothetical protein